MTYSQPVHHKNKHAVRSLARYFNDLLHKLFFTSIKIKTCPQSAIMRRVYISLASK